MREQPIHYMQQALNEARQAAVQNEVPVGAILVANNEIVARGHNQPIVYHDPTAHAEIIALRQAAELRQNYRLLNTTLYVTLEPCAMCVGAMIHARIENLVFGAFDAKAGAVVSVFRLLDDFRLNHRIHYTGGVMADECGQVLHDFFKARRVKAA